MARLHEKVKPLVSLKPNWDGYGSTRPSYGALLTATDVANVCDSLASPYSVVPVADGTVEVELSGHGLELTFSCGVVYVEVVLMERGKQLFRSMVRPRNLLKVIDLIRRLEHERRNQDYTVQAV